MQNQEMKSFPFWFGVDVSKESFTAAGKSILPGDKPVFPDTKAYTLDRNGARGFLKWAESIVRDGDYGILMEATGVYSTRLAAILKELCPSLHVAVCNATSISLYARSFSDEKNDKADAAIISRYGCERQPQEPRKLSPEQRRLREIVRARDSLVDQKLQTANRMESIMDKDVRRIQRGVIKSLDNAIGKLDDEIRSTVNSSEEIRHEVELMMTAPGVGFTSAACIYAEMGSLKNYTRKQVSAMSGVCPVNQTSGKSVSRHRMSRKGPRLLRKILYLDSNMAIRMIPALREFHARMLAKPDSSKMTAKCACMRKLLLILHAMVMRDEKFDPNHKSEKNMENVKKTI